MQKLNDFFDKVFVLNLERRPDRLDDFRKKAEKIGLEYEVFKSVDSKNIDRFGLVEGRPVKLESTEFYSEVNDYFLSQLGCLLSHLSVLKHCRDNNIKNVLILEDDVAFSDQFESRYEKFNLSFNKEWDMIYFSGSLVNKSDDCDSYSKLISCYTTHSYAVNSNVYDYLIEKIEHYMLSCPIDVVYSGLHSSINSWISIPFLTYQSDGFSDIQNSFTDYTSIKTYL